MKRRIYKDMINNERMTAFMNSFYSGNRDFLNQLRKQAVLDNVPIIRQETESLLKVLLRLCEPKHILEVGTAVGYSALLMSEAMPQDAHITTIEKYEKRIPIARENFEKAGKKEKITLLEGDAQEILSQLTGEFEFVFMDAAKAQYIYYLPEITRLVPTGGILVSDNVLQDGEILESRYLVTRRNRTIHARMREYLYHLTHTKEWETSIIPIGDGMTISVKCSCEE